MIRWPWNRPRPTDGEDARRRAEDALAQAQERRPEVHKVAESLKALRRQNNFADAVVASMRRHR